MPLKGGPRQIKGLPKHLLLKCPKGLVKWPAAISVNTKAPKNDGGEHTCLDKTPRWFGSRSHERRTHGVAEEVEFPSP